MRRSSPEPFTDPVYLNVAQAPHANRKSNGKSAASAGSADVLLEISTLLSYRPVVSLPSQKAPRPPAFGTRLALMTCHPFTERKGQDPGYDADAVRVGD